MHHLRGMEDKAQGTLGPWRTRDDQIRKTQNPLEKKVYFENIGAFVLQLQAQPARGDPRGINPH